MKACFLQSWVQIALRRSYSFRLESYERKMLQKYPDTFRGLPRLEVYIRLVELSDDPDRLSIRKDLFALRGIVSRIDEASRFWMIKECFSNAGPQPAIHQI
jgi:hypothetical protein